jgi:hypothetical protein
MHDITTLMILIKLLPESKPDTILGEIERDFLLFVEQGNFLAQKNFQMKHPCILGHGNNFNVSRDSL